MLFFSFNYGWHNSIPENRWEQAASLDSKPPITQAQTCVD